MDLIADSLLFAATIGAAAWCYVLAARLRRFTTLETGMGGAIAVLSAQVDEMTRALEKAQGIAGHSERRLAELTSRAEGLSAKLELMVAALHDIPDAGADPSAPSSQAVTEPEPGFFDEDEAPRLRFIRRRGASREAAE